MMKKAWWVAGIAVFSFFAGFGVCVVLSGNNIEERVVPLFSAQPYLDDGWRITKVVHHNNIAVGILQRRKPLSEWKR